MAAAERAREAGFDIVYVHGAEGGAIPQHFLMAELQPPHRRVRRLVENRARFWIETLEQVREAVGDDCAITARFASTRSTTARSDRASRGGLRLHRVRRPPRRLLGPQAGGYVAAEWAGDDVAASRFVGEFSRSRVHRGGAGRDPQADRRRSGGFTNPDTMAEAIRSGSDRHHRRGAPLDRRPVPAQARSKRAATRTSASASAATCAPRASDAGGADCLHPERDRSARSSAAAGTLRSSTRRPTRTRTVLVVGAGPAGMECAMVLGKRGMSAVHLVDDAGGDRRQHAR